MANIFGRKHDIDNRHGRRKIRGVAYSVSKLHELRPINGLKLERYFYPRSVNSAFYFIARLRKQNSTKLCEMLGSEPDLQMRVKNLRNSLQKIGVLKLLFVMVLISTKLCQMTTT